LEGTGQKTVSEKKSIFRTKWGGEALGKKIRVRQERRQGNATDAREEKLREKA